MNENTLDKKNFLNKLLVSIKKNIKLIVIFLSLCFAFFIFFQIFIFYSSNRIQKNSIIFFNNQNLENINLSQESILKLSNENNFYGILSKLELIEVNLTNKKYDYVIDMYKALLDDKNLDNVYKSSIASRASYQLIDINLADLSINYSDTIKSFILIIDEELISYKGVKLELNYLVKILEAEIKNIKYQNNKEAINLYNSIINSDVVSNVIKERISKIHEFFSYK